MFLWCPSWEEPLLGHKNVSGSGRPATALTEHQGNQDRLPGPEPIPSLHGHQELGELEHERQVPGPAAPLLAVYPWQGMVPL